jgi:hypothetical protein
MRKLVLLFILSLVMVIAYQNWLLQRHNIDASPNVIIGEWRKELDGRLEQDKDAAGKVGAVSKSSLKQMWDAWGERLFGSRADGQQESVEGGG